MLFNKQHIVKLTALIFSIMFMLLASGLHAQVKVTGHISAEVVDAASINNSLSQVIRIDNPQTNIELGSLRINTAAESAIDISVNNSKLMNESSSYNFPAAYKQMPTQGSEGSQDIALSAILSNEIQKGDYNGNITVIVSYN